MKYFLGVDAGGTKTHALIADETGQAVGFGLAGPGNWEGVGYDILTKNLLDVASQALEMAKIPIRRIFGAGFGLAGFDWPSQKQAHLDAIQPLKLACQIEIVNDATLGILAGAAEGWGISVVSGTGCNCRGWSKDYKHEGRVVGGAIWSGEAAGAFDIVIRAMQAVTYEWDKRGPATALTPAFIEIAGARDLDDLIEGMYTGKYDLNPNDARLVFQIAARDDPEALDVVRWAGGELGQMACAVIRQLCLEKERFDVVLIGSLFDGHLLLAETIGTTVHSLAPNARLVRLEVPPVVGGVVLGMQTAGLDARPIRSKLIETTRILLDDITD
ncbi:MAG TPA: BadF/BadG/BcrA/BcrD ATPase family protein [Anaerolineales bacterium]